MLTKKILTLIFALGLMLVAAPVMAVPVIPSINITDSDVGGITANFNPGDGITFSSSIIQEGTSTVGSVDWVLDFSQGGTPVYGSIGWNIFEPTSPTTISDTLIVILAPEQLPDTTVVFNTRAIIHFISGSIDETVNPLALTTSDVEIVRNLLETGSPQNVLESPINVTFSSDTEATPALPEPATMLLLGSGLIGMAGYGRKKFFKR